MPCHSKISETNVCTTESTSFRWRSQAPQRRGPSVYVSEPSAAAAWPVFFSHTSRSKQDNFKKTDNRSKRDVRHVQNNRKLRFISNLIHPINSSSNAISQHPVNQRTSQTLLRTAHYGANTPFRTVLNKSHIILYITGFQNRQEYRKSRDNSRNQYPVTYGSCANLYHPVYKRIYQHLKRPVNHSARQFTDNPASHGSSNL